MEYSGFHSVTGDDRGVPPTGPNMNEGHMKKTRGKASVL